MWLNDHFSFVNGSVWPLPKGISEIYIYIYIYMHAVGPQYAARPGARWAVYAVGRVRCGAGYALGPHVVGPPI